MRGIWEALLDKISISNRGIGSGGPYVCNICKIMHFYFTLSKLQNLVTYSLYMYVARRDSDIATKEKL